MDYFLIGLLGIVFGGLFFVVIIFIVHDIKSARLLGIDLRSKNRIYLWVAKLFVSKEYLDN